MPVEPRRAAQRVEVGLEHEVAVAALPARHRVAVDGVHVDVDGEQVVAALGAVADDRSSGTWARSGACPAGGPACRSGPAGRCRCRPRRSRPSARRGSWLRDRTLPAAPVAIMVGRHTNARARRHHRPPGARARPAGGRAAAARRRHHQPQLPPADGRRGPRRCACATTAPRCWDRPHDRGDRLAPRRRRAASRRRSSPSWPTCRRSSRAGCRAATSRSSRCARPA